MQLRGWGLTRASRIVIILLVVQHLGLGQILAFAPAQPTGAALTRPSQASAALDTVIPLTIPLDASGPSAAFTDNGSRAIPPDPAPLPRRLPRAPPAV
jgi:hypothetical protein